MADHTRSHVTTDLYKILSIPIKDICKGFKKWNPSEKSPRIKTIEGGGDRDFTPSVREPDKSRRGGERHIISAPTTPLGSSNHKGVDESFFANMTNTFSRNQSRRSKTPTPSPRSYSRNASRRRSKTPTSLSTNQSRRSNSDTEFLRRPLSRNSSRKVEAAESNETPISLSRETSRRHCWETNSSVDHARSLSRNASRRSPNATPIIYSQSTALKKLPPVEKKLECTLEELLEGCVKKIMIARAAIVNGLSYVDDDNNMEDDLDIYKEEI
ncbi:serine/arginine repetitive matrix protein 2-like [Momordica charantia]|uniref:Serine/arginine repetitive matrix protein 2-like n=1 Tax=Momordica charantia TaxID=3673 RepID=A0A6J1DXC3_MOMCH|nr:serine/arginine repetitive matrix protein 2-like [Momordica charantia]